MSASQVYDHDNPGYAEGGSRGISYHSHVITLLLGQLPISSRGKKKMSSQQTANSAGTA